MNSPNNTYIAQIKAAKVSLTIYCGNLPLTWQQQDLLKLLQPFGNILEIRLALKNNKFSGIAYVKF